MSAKKQIKHAEILEAAGVEFFTKGFDAATTLAIAQRAKISKRDLYQAFGSKRGILDAVITAHAQTSFLAPNALPPPKNRADFLDRLRLFGRIFLTGLIHPHKTAFYRLAIAEAPRNPDFGHALLEKGVLPVIACIENFMTSAVAQGIVPPEDKDLAIGAYFDSLIGQLQLRLLMGVRELPNEQEIQARAARAVEIVSRVIGPERA